MYVLETESSLPSSSSSTVGGVIGGVALLVTLIITVMIVLSIIMWYKKRKRKYYNRVRPFEVWKILCTIDDDSCVVAWRYYNFADTRKRKSNQERFTVSYGFVTRVTIFNTHLKRLTMPTMASCVTHTHTHT